MRMDTECPGQHLLKHVIGVKINLHGMVKEKLGPLQPLRICFSVFQSGEPERTVVTCQPLVSCILAWSVECDVRHIIAIN